METQKTWQKKKPATEFEKGIGRRIRGCRERLGMSADKLAEVLGVSTGSILHYELGVRSPSLERLAALTRELGISADYLLCGDSGTGSELAPDVSQITQLYGLLSPRDKTLVLEIVSAFAKVPPA